LARKSGLTGGLPWGFYGVAFSGFLFEMGLFMTQPIPTLHYLDIGASLGSTLAGVAAGVLSYPTIFTLLALLNLPTLPVIYAMRRPSKTIGIDPKPIKGG